MSATNQYRKPKKPLHDPLIRLGIVSATYKENDTIQELCVLVVEEDFDAIKANAPWKFDMPNGGTYTIWDLHDAMAALISLDYPIKQPKEDVSSKAEDDFEAMKNHLRLIYGPDEVRDPNSNAPTMISRLRLINSARAPIMRWGYSVRRWPTAYEAKVIQAGRIALFTKAGMQVPPGVGVLWPQGNCAEFQAFASLLSMSPDILRGVREIHSKAWHVTNMRPKVICPHCLNLATVYLAALNAGRPVGNLATFKDDYA